jgi:drug/metabolite transporter (DMT)-like permease
MAILLSILAVSTASILIRLTEAPPLAIATWRLALSTLILLPFFLMQNGVKKLQLIEQRDLISLLGIGIVLAIHFATWISSLRYTSVASSVILVHIDPIFVAIVSHFVFKERITPRQSLGIAVALIGAAVIAIGDLGVGDENLIGDALSLIGSIALGIYILAGRRLRQRLDLTTYVTPVYAVSSVILALSALILDVPLTGYNARTIIMFGIIALVPMIFGHTVYNWALRWVSAPLVSISLLGEPVGASILAVIVLSEKPLALTIIGGAITLIGILICIYSSGKNK